MCLRASFKSLVGQFLLAVRSVSIAAGMAFLLLCTAPESFTSSCIIQASRPIDLIGCAHAS